MSTIYKIYHEIRLLRIVLIINKIAEYHIKHLSEFAIREKLTFNETECIKEVEGHWIASLNVSEEEMKKVRDALRPHRGTLA